MINPTPEELRQARQLSASLSAEFSEPVMMGLLVIRVLTPQERLCWQCCPGEGSSKALMQFWVTRRNPDGFSFAEDAAREYRGIRAEWAEIVPLTRAPLGTEAK